MFTFMVNVSKSREGSCNNCLTFASVLQKFSAMACCFNERRNPKRLRHIALHERFRTEVIPSLTIPCSEKWGWVGIEMTI